MWQNSRFVGITIIDEKRPWGALIGSGCGGWCRGLTRQIVQISVKAGIT